MLIFQLGLIEPRISHQRSYLSGGGGATKMPSLILALLTWTNFCKNNEITEDITEE